MLNNKQIFLLQVLSDDEKKSLYDRYGEAGLKGAGMGGMGVRYSKQSIGDLFFKDPGSQPSDHLLVWFFLTFCRISVIRSIYLSHYLKVWVGWEEVEWVEVQEAEPWMVKMSITH